jgi:hypothetical protein
MHALAAALAETNQAFGEKGYVLTSNDRIAELTTFIISLTKHDNTHFCEAVLGYSYIRMPNSTRLE